MKQSEVDRGDSAAPVVIYVSPDNKSWAGYGCIYPEGEDMDDEAVRYVRADLGEPRMKQSVEKRVSELETELRGFQGFVYISNIILFGCILFLKLTG